MSGPDDVVILGGARTPFGKINGALASFQATELGGFAIAGALRNARITPEQIDAVIMGHVVQAGCGQNPARQAAINASIGWSTPATTINKVCLSGLAAITDATRLLRSGEANIVVAGGQESMTNGPHLLPGSRSGWTYGSFTALDSVARDGLSDAFDGQSMGATTEQRNNELGISRAEQDEIAAASHQRAAQAQQNGTLAAEIAAVTIQPRKGDPIHIQHDESIRPDTTTETLARLRPAFAPSATESSSAETKHGQAAPKGTITAGNASPLSDGAAALVLTTRAHAERLGLPWLAIIGRAGQVAGPDMSLHSQPSNAIRQALDRAHWTTKDLDSIEINEAFGAVVAQSLKDLDYPLSRTNLHGGAIALGHPIGASGARLALHVALELDRRGTGKAAVSLCGGGGQGEALLLYRD